MRIAIFIKNTIHHESYGGLETQNQNLVEGLKKAGHLVTVFAPALNKSVADHVFVSGTTPGKYNGAWWFRSFVEFNQQHEKAPFDVVISQSAAGAGIIFRKTILRVKTLVIAHGTIWGEIRTSWRKAKTWQDYLFFLKNLAYAVRTYFVLDRKYLKNCDHIVAVSDAVKAALQSEFGLIPEKISVINNGVDLTHYKVAPVLSEKVIFLYLGRLEAEKGLALLMEAFLKLRQTAPTALLKIVGSGSYAVSSGVGVEVVPAVGYAKIPELLATASVFVLPTLRVEGLPMTLVEAAAAGLPIIASNIGGNAAAVRDGLNGLLIKPGSVLELLIAMEKLARDAGMRQQFGAASRKLAGDNFSLGTMVTKYLKVINHL
jgi:glycosyltransferase involved in cell wall biosynthesis